MENMENFVVEQQVLADFTKAKDDIHTYLSGFMSHTGNLLHTIQLMSGIRLSSCEQHRQKVLSVLK